MGRRVAEGLLGFLIVFPAVAQIQITAVTTSAGFVPGLPAYGGLCTIFVSGLTGIHGVVNARSLPLPVSLAGVQVYFGNLAAPIYGVASLNGYQQINIQVPYESSIFSITVSQGSAVSSPVTPSFDAAPGEFFQDADGRAIVQHANDYSLVTPSHPAVRGETLVAYMSGLGAVSPPVVSGMPVPADPISYALIFIDRQHDALSLNVGGAPTDLLFAGLTPGFAGLYQINFQVPAGTASGDVPMTLAQVVCPFGCGSTGPYTLTSRSVKLAIR